MKLSGGKAKREGWRRHRKRKQGRKRKESRGGPRENEKEKEEARQHAIEDGPDGARRQLEHMQQEPQLRVCADSATVRCEGRVWARGPENPGSAGLARDFERRPTAVCGDETCG